MENLLEFKSDILNFWELEEDSKDKLVRKIEEYASTKNVLEFSEEVRTNFEQVKFSGISTIYEALSMGENPEKWYGFFKEEYERAFKTAETAENAFDVLDSLIEISFVGDEETPFTQYLISFLSNHLSNKKDAIRYKAIAYIGDWLPLDNLDNYSNIIRTIESKLKDDNWKLRYISKLTLEDIEKMPSNYKLSFIDKIKLRLFDPHTF